MVFLASLSAISIDNRGDGWDGRRAGWGGTERNGWGGVGWGGRWQKLPLGHSMSSHDAHTNDTPVAT